MSFNTLADIDWFKWNGVKCTDYGMHVLQQPTITRAAERVSNETIPGRSGSLTLTEGEEGDYIYDDINLSCVCVIDDPYMIENGVNVSRIAKISGWLKGDGTVIFANRQEGYYKARITNQIQFAQIVQGNPHRSFSVQFRCNPSLYLTDGETPITSTTSPVSLANSGNIYSLPLIKVTPNASTEESATIMCGSSTMIINSFKEISYILIDSEAKIAYTGQVGSASDPVKLLGTRVIGNWLKIPEGNSLITYTGNVKSIEITPRWRCV